MKTYKTTEEKAAMFDKILNKCNEPENLLLFTECGAHFDLITDHEKGIGPSIESLINTYRFCLAGALEASSGLDKKGIERPWVKIIDKDRAGHGRMRLEIR